METTVRKLWDDLQIVDDALGLAFLKKKPKIAEALAPFSDDEVLAAIREVKDGKTEEKPRQAGRTGGLALNTRRVWR